MDLSVIIVNYNVKHFLAQCLLSVRKAMQGIDGEVIVVDNTSVDGSQQMLKEQFSHDIILIENTDNVGFSKANNQGIHISKGKYVLLLNPDTVVEEDTFRKVLAFMEANEDAGAVGVRMIDGDGKFLPESKRALPTPWVSFYKIFGLSSLFPNSKKFGKYHLSFLDPNEIHEIEILSGAFMFMRKEALDKAGYLDEDFFMYGEDIDLSYRIVKAGYKNYYFPHTKIIHYKGESTKKGSLNYVRVFYQAMIIFAEKHFGGRRKRLFITGIRAAVYMRALIAIAKRFFDRFAFPAFESLLVYTLIIGIKSYWEHYVKYIEGGQYPWQFDWIAAPVYTLVLISFLWVAGAYQKPYRLKPIITATLAGFVGMATFSYIFNHLNYSRAIVGLSSVFTMILAITTRGTINWREKGNFFFGEMVRKRAVVVGNAKGVERVLRLIQHEFEYPVELVGVVSEEPIDHEDLGVDAVGQLLQLEEIVRFYSVDEVIFDNASVSTGRILDCMSGLGGVNYKIVPPKADYMIGPHEILSARYTTRSHFLLAQREERYQKRIFDLLMSLSLLLFFPINFWLYKKPMKALQGLWQVLRGKKHLVGYIQADEKLPPLKPALLSMQNRIGTNPDSFSLSAKSLDTYYAKSYNWYLDLEILLKSWREMQ